MIYRCAAYGTTLEPSGPTASRCFTEENNPTTSGFQIFFPPNLVFTYLTTVFLIYVTFIPGKGFRLERLWSFIFYWQTHLHKSLFLWWHRGSTFTRSWWLRFSVDVISCRWCNFNVKQRKTDTNSALISCWNHIWVYDLSCRYSFRWRGPLPCWFINK